MSKPLLLDLFCGAGGVSAGYVQAGFDVIGVDLEPMPRYPYGFFQEDALQVLDILLAGQEPWHGYRLPDFAAIHASPPCQGYSESRHIAKVSAKEVKEYPLLIQPVRERLVASGLPWIIENVAYSDLPDALELCGSMFGLGVAIGKPIQRHRWFASSQLLFAPGPCRHSDCCINPVGGHIRGYGKLASGKTYIDGKGRTRKRESSLRLADGQAAMEIDWMTIPELCQAIPPAYTKWLGHQVLQSSGLAA